MALSQYLEALNKRYKTGITTEHSFRGDLQQLVESMAPGVLATNEPIRIACGAPDFIITKKNIPLGYIEAKDIGVDLTNKNLKEQFDRYRHALDNLIFTDYLDFHFYKSGAFVTSIRIAKTEGNKIIPLTEKLDEFTALIKDFCSYTGQTIKSSKTLAEMMAGKARMLADVIENSLNSDEENAADSSLKEQMKAFKDILIHDITAKEFSDIYAQTVAYGMFAARLHDPSIDSFTRQEAAELIPKSNPFLRKLFGYIAGPDIDERIVWIVDALADIFRATDVAALLKNFGKATQQQDPVIHFYETFLAAYDPKLRKARGVWYTPEPVVNFIVRAVDDILKTEFNLPDGLADRSKTKVKVKAFTKDKGKHASAKEVEQEVEVHKVQILDPATGTGTFLAEVIKQVYKKFEGQQGLWSNYVEEHLVPRLNGFELLMASYAMAHLKLDLLLTETGYKPKKQNRLRVYLTNSLEEHHPDTGTLFANWLSTEANEANHIKRDTPVMVVMGNPPYSGESANKGEWIMELMEDYKKEPGGKEKLKEKNPKWINDDYVKFLRYGQHFIEKNGEGVLAFINAHGFLDNPTFRGMRWNLLNTYDKIYILDLHGNSKKKETAPDGSADVNVFDIQQGVSINLFIKTGKKKTNELGKIFHFDLFGMRDTKYDFLFENNIKTVTYRELPNVSPNYFFVGKDFEEQKNYNKGFLVNDLFTLNNVGIVTARDNFTIHDSKKDVEETIKEFLKLDDETARKRFDLGKDARDWQVSFAKKDLQNHYPNKGQFVRINYRPFDIKWTYYTGKSKGFHCYPRNEIMQHFLKGDNVGLNYIRPMSGSYEFSVFISNNITDQCSAGNKSAGAGISFIAPVYLYPEINSQKTLYEKQERTPNLNIEIVTKIANDLNLHFTWEKGTTNPFNDKQTFAPIDILDYIYAVLHSPTYREKYKEFLKIDFPRVPYPKDANTFWQLVKLGGELRQIHLLESKVVNKPITKFLVDGDNVVGKISFQPYVYMNEVPDKNGNFNYPDYAGSVYINDTQYFKDVPVSAWDFYIGGYQPAQKWLKDRKGRTLNFDDIVHYQKIIVALTETDRLMKEIDKIKIE
jgi:predicted helicase